MIDVFVSHAPEDFAWAESLAVQLRDRGLDVYLDEWHVLPGDVVVHQLERAFRESRSGIAVISPVSERSPQAREEYAALVEQSWLRGLRFIPVLIGDAPLPPFATTRVYVDLRELGGAAYTRELDRLAATISRRPTAECGRAIGVCYVKSDAEYGRRLVDRIAEEGLPVWSPAQLRPGDERYPTIRRCLRESIAIVVLMSERSQEDDEITSMILEGRIHQRPFVPILLGGRRNYQLAHSWYLDARDRRLPAAEDLVILHGLHAAARSQTPIDLVTTPPVTSTGAPAPAARIPLPTTLAQLDRYLADGEFEYADLLTTTILLEAAGRLEEGWLRRRDGVALPSERLTAIDELWARHTDARQGFTAQRGLAELCGRRDRDFLCASLAYGWHISEDDVVPRYHPDFTDRAGLGRRDGFFPTLRNPQNEHFGDWYPKWIDTVKAVHLRLREWSGA